MLFSVCSLSLACDLSTLELFTASDVLISSSMPTRGDVAEENTGTPRSLEQDESPMVNEVFSMFKTCLESKLDEKTKQLESKSKLDKQVTQMKFKATKSSLSLMLRSTAFSIEFARLTIPKISKCMICYMKEKSSFVSG